LHGSDVLCDVLSNDNYFSNHDVELIRVTSQEYGKYYNREFELYEQNKQLGILHEKNVTLTDDRVMRMCRTRSNICPIWLIQDDIKKRLIKHNEWCYILDLDEFVCIERKEIGNIVKSSATHVEFSLIDRVHESHVFVRLKKSPGILDQFNKKVWLTKKMNRYTDKVCMTKGHAQHSSGHHYMYNKKGNVAYKNRFPVWHCKWFEQSIKKTYTVNAKQHQQMTKDEKNFINNERILINLDHITYDE